MNSLIQVATPAVEPVLVPEMLLQLGMGTPADGTLDAQLVSQLTGLLLAARTYVENSCRIAIVTQSWLFQGDSWPGTNMRYNVGGAFHSEFRIPKPPFQSIAFFQYVDVTGTIQPLSQDLSFGNSTAVYAYQLDPGFDTRPARLLPAWARPWPPTRWVANAVALQFKCGFGGPVSASMAIDTAILTGPVFNQGDIGQQVNVPGAVAGVGGAPATALATTIASVDVNGQATLAAPATAAVALATNNVYAGLPVPEPIRQAIKFLAQHFYTHGADADMPMPRVIGALLEPYMNRVS